MNYGLIRRKVADFSKWKAAYDSYLAIRQKAGLKEKCVLHNIDDPNEVITLFELEDVQKAREFFNSADLRGAMQQAGTADKPDFYLLSD
jgi:hypothetical protein